MPNVNYARISPVCNCQLSLLKGAPAFGGRILMVPCFPLSGVKFEKGSNPNPLPRKSRIKQIPLSNLSSSSCGAAVTLCDRALGRKIWKDSRRPFLFLRFKSAFRGIMNNSASKRKGTFGNLFLFSQRSTIHEKKIFDRL